MGTSLRDIGVVIQTDRGNGVPLGSVADLWRSSGTVLNSDGELTTSNSVNRGHLSGVSSSFNSSSGNHPYEAGKDGDGAMYAPIGLVLRRSHLPPDDFTAQGSYVLTDNGPLAAATLEHIAGQDFADAYGRSGFPVRTHGFPDAANDRVWPVNKVYDNAGTSTIVFEIGATSGPAASPGTKTFWGQPAVTSTEVVVVQFGRLSDPGETITQLTIVEKWGELMDEWSIGENETLGDHTTTFAAGAHVMHDAAFLGGKRSKLQKLNPLSPPKGSTAVAPTVNLAVLPGASTMAITAAGVETIAAGDYFTVAGSRGTFKFLQDATAIVGEIAAPAGAFFTPATPDGFLDDAIITIHHGPGFTPERTLPTTYAKSRSNGSLAAGGLTLAALCTNRTNESVLLTCGGPDSYGGFTGGNLSIASGNSGDDDPLCTERKGVIEGDMAATVSVDINLKHNLDDRETLLTSLGDAGDDAQSMFFLFGWLYPREANEELPAMEGWVAPAAVSTEWGFAGGAGGAAGAGTMPLTCGESVNDDGEFRPDYRHFSFPRILSP